MLRMNFWRTAGLLAAMSVICTAPALAGVIVDFEDSTPTIASGDTITTTQGLRFSSDGFGFSGIDNAGAFVFGNAPTNANGNFLFALNNDGVTVESTSIHRFQLQGFDFSFIAPLGGIGSPGEAAGILFVVATDGVNAFSNFFEFPAADSDGNFGFSSINESQLGELSGHYFTRALFFSCIYDGPTSCNDSSLLVPSQFALDNIRAQVPEPASLALLLSGLLLTGMARRRAFARR